MAISVRVSFTNLQLADESARANSGYFKVKPLSCLAHVLCLPLPLPSCLVVALSLSLSLSFFFLKLSLVLSLSLSLSLFCRCFAVVLSILDVSYHHDSELLQMQG